MTPENLDQGTPRPWLSALLIGGLLLVLDHFLLAGAELYLSLRPAS